MLKNVDYLTAPEAKELIIYTWLVIKSPRICFPVKQNITREEHTVKCRYNAVFGVQEIDRVIAVTAL